MTALALTDKDLATLAVDAVVVGLVSGTDGPTLAPGAEAVDAALSGRLLEALVALGASGGEDEVTKLATFGALAAPVVAAVGLGPVDGTPSAETVRRAAGAASRALGGRATVASALAHSGNGLVQAAGEGALLGAYQFTGYKTKPVPPGRRPPSTVQLVVGSARDREAKAALRRAEAVGAAVTLCRDLINSPPNDLYPAEFAARAETAGRAAGLTVEVLDEKALEKGGYGGILGVGMGSVRPPRLVRMSYRGPSGRKGAMAKVALVGKGITFDTGGISIKPSQSMENMKSDMSGAAAVVATMTLVAALELRVDVTATVPMAENMPGGAAYRPADVLTFRNGTKAEILNTDAEGRVILADAIARACEDEPDYLVETSTLTGAQLVALGMRTSGVMGSDAMRDRVVAAGRRSGEGMWGMPLPPEVRKGLDSQIADFANVGDRSGGMLAGGHFLAEFVTEGVQWAHIDIAGPAYNTGSPWGYTVKGGTGVPVRTLLELLEDIAANG